MARSGRRREIRDWVVEVAAIGRRLWHVDMGRKSRQKSAAGSKRAIAAFGRGGDEDEIAKREHLLWVFVVSEIRGKRVGKGSPKILIESGKEATRCQEDTAHIRGPCMATPVAQAEVRSLGGVDVGEASEMTCQRQDARESAA
jgi:hypothetical protein